MVDEPELPTKTDTVFDTPGQVEPFEFNQTVVDVFPDMIDRSVPGYKTMLPIIGLIAKRYAQPHTHIYDLGCSLGAATLAMRARVKQPGCRIIGVDNSAAMIASCRKILAVDTHPVPVQLIQAEMQGIELINASVVVLNFTLQFIDPAERAPFIRKIADSMVPGGVLILSEKIIFEDPIKNEAFIDIHHDFKRDNGYSELEIAQKRKALEHVLVPETVADHRERCLSAGFSRFEQWFQGINFASFMAIK